jgi:hypothetical protein
MRLLDVLSRTREPMTFSTMNLSSTVIFGKCQLSQIAVDHHHLVVNSMRSGIPAANDGPRWRVPDAEKHHNCAWCWALRGVFSASYFGAGGCQEIKRAPNLNIVMQNRRCLAAKLQL